MFLVYIEILPTKTGQQLTLTAYVFQCIHGSELILAVPSLEKCDSFRKLTLIDPAHRVTYGFPALVSSQRDKISDELRHRLVDRQPAARAGQQGFSIVIIIKDGCKVVRNSAIGVQRLEVSITARKRNIPASFCDASQHTQVPY